MSRDNKLYKSHVTSKRRNGRRSPDMERVCLALLIAFILVIIGLCAYVFANGSKETPEGRPTEPPVEEPSHTPTAEPTPESSVAPEPSATPEPSPTPESTMTPTPVPTVNPAVLRGEKVKGAYVGTTLNTEERLKQWLKAAEDTELNAVIIDVKLDGGQISYAMDLKQQGATRTIYPDMPGLIQRLKERGIYCIARIVCFKDSTIDNYAPELMIHNPDGTIYKDNAGDTWMNPYNKKVWDYLLEISRQAVKDGFDEICYDYIRFPGSGIIAGKTENGYEYRVDFGPEAEGISLEEIVEQFTAYAYEQLKPTGAVLSASVFGISIRTAQEIGQNYVNLARHLDFICPMVYPSHYSSGYAGFAIPNNAPYELLLSELGHSRKRLEALLSEDVHCAKVRPWLQAFSATWLKGTIPYTGEVVREQVRASYDVGYNTWMLWNASGKYPDGCFLQKTEELR